MKDYIYFDERLINSLLAQLTKGEVNLSKSFSSSDGKTISTIISSEKSENFGLSKFINFIKKSSKKDEINNGNSSSVSSLVDTRVDDFSLDTLYDLIHKKIKQPNDANENDFVDYSNNFKIFDFETIKELTSGTSDKDVSDLHISRKSENIYNYYKLMNSGKIDEANELKLSMDPREIKLINNNLVEDRERKSLHTVSTLANKIYPETILIKVGDSLVFAPKNNFRISQSETIQLGFKKKQLHVLGIVEAIATTTGSLYDPDMDRTDNTVNYLETTNLTPILSATKIFDILKVSRTQDLFIRPIAMYFKIDD
ncbi:DUF6414 family protein [Fructobacillus cardui]|uniref:DUF6414 family protein n=1 Tax=Fructobacillus cardui TaxID=2893170 RepID=UPI00200A0D01|nr:hypothetical protein [Fructobacillus cardui]MCK8627301.1 hypothetical protein [Fructobacillus cardui]